MSKAICSRRRPQSNLVSILGWHVIDIVAAVSLVWIVVYYLQYLGDVNRTQECYKANHCQEVASVDLAIARQNAQ